LANEVHLLKHMDGHHKKQTDSTTTIQTDQQTHRRTSTHHRNYTDGQHHNYTHRTEILQTLLIPIHFPPISFDLVKRFYSTLHFSSSVPSINVGSGSGTSAFLPLSFFPSLPQHAFPQHASNKFPCTWKREVLPQGALLTRELGTRATPVRVQRWCASVQVYVLSVYACVFVHAHLYV